MEDDNGDNDNDNNNNFYKNINLFHNDYISLNFLLKTYLKYLVLAKINKLYQIEEGFT